MITFPTTWSWDFGDGTTSDVKNPVHIYTAAGNYTINLTVTNALGSSAAQKTGYIRIAPVAVPLDANFTSDLAFGPAPLAVNFMDLSEGFPTGADLPFISAKTMRDPQPAADPRSSARLP